MTFKSRLRTPVLSIFLGWLCAGIGYGTPIQPTLNTILFIGGIVFFVFGVIRLISVITK